MRDLRFFFEPYNFTMLKNKKSPQKWGLTKKWVYVDYSIPMKWLFDELHFLQQAPS